MDTSTRSFLIRRGSDLGGAVAEARRARGLTQTELAERIGVNRAYLAAIEGGRTNRLVEHLLRAFRRLGAEVTVTWSTDEESRSDG